MSDRILLINYDFPPAVSGVRRIVKMVKYLPDSGLQPLVLAATPPGGRVLDTEALEEIEQQGCPVWRTISPDLNHLQGAITYPRQVLRKLRGKLDMAAATPSESTLRNNSLLRRTPTRLLAGTSSFARRLMALPDDCAPWLATAIPTAEHLLKSRAIRYVFTSSYPNSSHLVGLYLKQRYNIHWHADFRDGWTQNPYFANYLTPLHRRANYAMERAVINGADTLTAVSQPIVDYLHEVSGKDNVFLLPNGFDRTDLEGLPDLPTEKFRIAYTGTMFMQRSPDGFFAAVRGLLDCYPGLENEIEIIFRSNFKPEHTAMIRDLGLEKVIMNWGLGTWKEALALQKSADVLLVLEGESPNAHIMLTQKIFEYLATGRPILAVAPEGALADLVRATRAGVVIHPDNVFRIKETLFELFLGRMGFTRNMDVINSYTRQQQAAELAHILRTHGQE